MGTQEPGCPEADLADEHVFNDVMVNGSSVAQAFSHQVWLHYRDYTTDDLTSMYGPSSAQVTTIQIIYGDPSLIIYSPEWQSPVPIAGLSTTTPLFFLFFLLFDFT